MKKANLATKQLRIDSAWHVIVNGAFNQVPNPDGTMIANEVLLPLIDELIVAYIRSDNPGWYEKAVMAHRLHDDVLRHKVVTAVAVLCPPRVISEVNEYLDEQQREHPLIKAVQCNACDSFYCSRYECTECPCKPDFDAFMALKKEHAVATK